MITKRKFDLLTYLEKNKEYIPQRDLARAVAASLGAVNKDLQELEAASYIEAGRISEEGIKALEPYRVQRAIFIAAGFGSRLAPLTLNTPKPLIRVNGTRMIDTTLDAVLAAGIEEIFIVRGYLSEQFNQLLYKYPMIKFVENPQYNEANNISSAMCVKSLYKNSYVFDGDLILSNKSLITKYQYSSNYLAIPVDRTDEWVLESRNGRVTGVAIGGRNTHKMLGISYWTEEAGQKFSEHVKEVYDAPGGKERFWDQVILEHHLDEYDLRIRECQPGDVVEIDTLSELIEIDNSYDF